MNAPAITIAITPSDESTWHFFRDSEWPELGLYLCTCMTAQDAPHAWQEVMPLYAPGVPDFAAGPLFYRRLGEVWDTDLLERLHGDAAANIEAREDPWDVDEGEAA